MIKRMFRNRTPEQFKERFKGLPAQRLWVALDELTPGTNWRGCAKSYMADQWANGHKEMAGQRRIGYYTLDQIANKVLEHVEAKEQVTKTEIVTYNTMEIAAELFRYLRSHPAADRRGGFRRGEAKEVWKAMKEIFPGVTDSQLQLALEVIAPD